MLPFWIASHALVVLTICMCKCKAVELEMDPLFASWYMRLVEIGVTTLYITVYNTHTCTQDIWLSDSNREWRWRAKPGWKCASTAHTGSHHAVPAKYSFWNYRGWGGDPWKGKYHKCHCDILVMIEPILHVCIVGIKICYCADVRIATVDDCRDFHSINSLQVQVQQLLLMAVVI